MTEQLLGTPSLHPKLAAILPPPDGNPYIYAREPIRSFLPVAIQEGAHLSVPPNIHPERWSRCQVIVNTYYQTPSDTYQIGAARGLTHETVRLDIRDFILGLHANVSPQTQQDFTLPDLKHNLSKGKPAPEYELLIQYGLGNRIMTMLEAGVDRFQISRVLKIPLPQLNKRLRLLRALARQADVDLSVPLQYTPQETRQLIEDLKNQTKTDPQVQLALNTVKRTVFDINQRSKEDDKFLTSLVNLARDSGYHIYWRNIAQFVRPILEANIPMMDLPIYTPKHQRQYIAYHHLIVAWHQARAIAAWDKEDSLQAYLASPVRQILGPTEPPLEPPSTWRVQQRKGLSTLGTIFADFGITSSMYPAVLARLRPGCPVPVFQHQNQNAYVYPTDQQDKLRGFITDRLNLIPANSPQI